VKAEYAWLRHTLTVVTRERDSAVKEKHQLQAKLENLEQVLKVGWPLCSVTILASARDQAAILEQKVAQVLSTSSPKFRALWAAFALSLVQKAINNKV
jgi:hypothetical protein